MVQLPPSTAVAERDAVTAFVWLRTRNDLPAALAGATLHPRPGFGQDRPSSPSTQHRSTIPVRRGVRAGDSNPHVRGPPPAGGAGPPRPEPPAPPHAGSSRPGPFWGSCGGHGRFVTGRQPHMVSYSE